MMRSVVVWLFLVQAVMVKALYLKTTSNEDGDQLYTEGGEKIWDGDMVLSQNQIKALFDPINTRKAVDDLRRLWPEGHVPYRIDSSSQGDQQVIREALRHWMAATCIKFEEISDESYNKPHLIFRKSSGCHSHVGRYVEIAGQEVSIGNGCAVMGTVSHEVGHAIGFYHEQSRPERDDFVKILDYNIIESDKKYFSIYGNINNYGISYDLGSIMHYGLDAFSKNKLNTIVPLDVTKTFLIGQRNGLSFLDIKLANKMYNCDDQCSIKPQCENEGFVDKSCKCQCPPGFKGTICETKYPLEEPLCGGIITEETTINTPNYPNPYPKDITCIWQIKAPEDKHVTVHFEEFDLIYHDTAKHKCAWDILEIRSTKDLFDGEKYCGDELDNETVNSEGNQMVLLFKSDHDLNKGFKASVKFT